MRPIVSFLVLSLALGFAATPISVSAQELVGEGERAGHQNPGSRTEAR